MLFLQCLLKTLIVLQFNKKLAALSVIDQNQQYNPLTVKAEVQIESAKSPTASATIFIRHSRSRANRYLHNESERALRVMQNANESSTYQPPSNVHSSLQNAQNVPQPSTTSASTSVSTVTEQTISSAVTHKIRMLHKKQVMESKRKSSDGIKFHHRSLVQAEQLQGRPIAESTNSNSNSVQNSNSKNDFDEVSVEEYNKEINLLYQNDEYLGATLPSILLPLPYDTTSAKKVEKSPDYHISNASKSTMMATTTATTTTKVAITKLYPVESMLSQVPFPNDSNHLLKETHIEGASASTPQQIKYDDDNKQQFISALNPSTDSSDEEEALQKTNFLKYKNDSSLSALVPHEKHVNRSTKLIMVDLKRGDLMSLGNNIVENTSNDPSLMIQQQQLSLNSQTDKLEDATVDDALMDNRQAHGFPLESDDSMLTTAAGDDEEPFENNPLLEGVIDAANEDEIYDWDEISRNNRRNLMRGRDVVTKFLQIVETQHSLGSKCEAGTSLNLGEGVVDRYAQDRFRVEAEVAVNRANMLTRIFKMTSAPVQADVNLLHASVLSMVEFDDDIFAAGNCFDWNEHPSQMGLFCPFAYRLPPPHLGAIIAKDLANEYHYLGNTSEWFFQARKNAEKVIARNEQYLKAFHLYTNKTEERVEDDTLAVKYEDGRWSKPYYDCGGGNIWMLTYTVPFFGYENGTYHFKGTSGIDIDLRRVDIDQCPQRNMPGTTQPLNIFAGTDKCKQRTTMCHALKGLGFRRGSYKCVCRKGYYFPDTTTVVRFFNGSLLEEEYEKLMLGSNSSYNTNNEYECLPCAEGCDSCEDSSPCIAALNWPMRTSILMLACTVIGLLPPAAWFTFRYQQVKVVRAASPALLRVIALGAFFIYCTNIVMYPNPNLYTCTARIWLREIGFSLTYGALMLKTWRISVIFRVRSAKAVKITDAALLKRLGMICAVIGTCLLVRTLVAPPDVVVGRTANDLKAFLCKTDWWDYTFTSMEVLFLAWGVRLCIMVRKAPSEFNESRFISMAIYNEFLLTCFLNVSMFFLQSPANPDLLYIIFFCHTQLTVTLLLCLIFGSKVYIVLRSGKSHQENMGMSTKATGAKFNFRPQVRTFTNQSTVSSSGGNSAETKLSDQEALEEIRQLSVRLQRIQEMAPPKGVAVMTISSLLDGLRTPGNMMLVAAAASSATNNPSTTLTSTSQIPSNYVAASNSQTPKTALPLLENMQKLQHEQQTPITTNCNDRAVNTEISTLSYDAQTSAGYVICGRCLTLSKDTLKMSATCKELGSPQTEGSISFSKLKLDCMCSQSDDLHQFQSQPRLSLNLGDPEVTIKRCQMRSAATNTPPLNVNRRCVNCPMQAPRQASSGSCKSLQINALQHICDTCKKKYRSGSNNSFNSSALGGLGGGSHSRRRKSHKRLAGNLFGNKRQQSLEKNITASSSKTLMTTTKTNSIANEVAVRAVHSTDDIMLCTTITNSSRSPSSSSSSSCCDSKEKYSRSSSESNSEKISTATTRQKLQPRGCTQSSKVLSVQLPDNTQAGPEALTCESVSSANITDIGVADECAGSSNIVVANPDVATTANDAESNKTNGNNGAGTTSRNKRPDKLVLDLNDRSKYSKEVSV